MSEVAYRTESGVAVITIRNPPVNGLSHAVRGGIAAALDRALADAGVRAVVLTGSGDIFSAGADVREFGTDASRAEPTLPDLTQRIENSPKPVIAAIAGNCLGGGLELAMAAHHRVARPDAKLGLPEVKLGLIPGAGGTQRLPRLVGPERAIAMVVSGEPVSAAELAGTLLLDRVLEGDLVAAAAALAALPGSDAPRRARDLPLEGSAVSEACGSARTRVDAAAHPLPAPWYAVSAIEAAALPFEQGLAVERRLFQELMETPESKALRYAFFAERAAGKVEGITAETPVRPIAEAAVIGAGTMGSGIAVALLDAGIPVRLLESDQAALDRGLARVRGIYDAQVKKGKLTPAEQNQRLEQLRPVLSYDDVAPVDLVIEAVFESLAVKREVFVALDRIANAGAILATNTSTLDVNRIASFTGRPADVLGLHFFSPAHAMRLLEIVRGAATAPEVLATALRLAKRLGKVAVVSKVCDGFIGNRMLDAYVRQAWYLVEEGATPEQIDRAMEAFGFAMGPFRVGDLVGLDVSHAIRQRRRAERPDYRCSTLPDRLCEVGRLGQKSGGGWYDYPDGPRHPAPSPAVARLIAAHRQEIGVAFRPIDDPEIVDRLVFALAIEGVRILEEGIAARAGDIDVVYLHGYGFPRWRGGPMYYAQQVGWERVRQRASEFARHRSGDPDFWSLGNGLVAL